MTNKQFIKQNQNLNTPKKNTNVLIGVLKVIEDICGLVATICWILLLVVIAILTLGQGFGSKYSNVQKTKYGTPIYKD